MRQCDHASATAFASGSGGPGVSDLPRGSARLEMCVSARERTALNAMLPDFVAERRAQTSDANGLTGVVAWSGLRARGRAQRRATALGVPFILLGEGLLRAPPGWGAARPTVSATAHSINGPSSP